MKLWVKIGLGVGGAIITALGGKAWVDRHIYDEDGYNGLGYNRDGYDAKGFDIHGFDHSGYDRLGYNRDGLDRSRNDRNVYASIIIQMEANQTKAYNQLNAHEFRYALSDIRVGIESGIKAILAHKLGKGYETNTLDRNIGVCESHRLFDQEFIEKLYGAKNHCNAPLHGDVEKTVDQVFFCYKVLCEVTDELKLATGLNGE